MCAHGTITHSLSFECNSNIVQQLLRNPTESVGGVFGGYNCQFKIISPNYMDVISEVYGDKLKQGLDYYNSQLRIPVMFTHFGLCVRFDEAAEIHLHDDNMLLPKSVKILLTTFGAVIFKNIFLDSSVRDMGHKNRFPQLNFHVDRIPSQTSYYSVYTRNPFDHEQKHPRTSSTLFLPMLVAYLQAMTEGKHNILNEDGLINNCVLFDEKNIIEYLNTVVVQHQWNEPVGVGEMSIINNCNLLHSSYYPNVSNKGYRIGVRYLA